MECTRLKPRDHPQRDTWQWTTYIQCTVTKMVRTVCRPWIDVQVGQTKRGVRSTAPPTSHQNRICFYGACCHGFPCCNAALFLNRLVHQELSFSGRQNTDMQICVYTKLPSLSANPKTDTHCSASAILNLSLKVTFNEEEHCWKDHVKAQRYSKHGRCQWFCAYRNDEGQI